MTATTLFGTAPDNGAEISLCDAYRYRLWRRWDPAQPAVVFVMLNPSTADATHDDPTIRRCIGFARSWGAGGIEVVNLYPWRAVKPEHLDDLGPAVLGDPDSGVDLNDRAIRAAAAGASRIVAAWGANAGPYPTRPARVLEVLRAAGRPIVALGLTKRGQPRHPLYVRGDAQPVPYPPEESGQ